MSTYSVNLTPDASSQQLMMTDALEETGVAEILTDLAPFNKGDLLIKFNKDTMLVVLLDKCIRYRANAYNITTAHLAKIRAVPWHGEICIRTP